MQGEVGLEVDQSYAFWLRWPEKLSNSVNHQQTDKHNFSCLSLFKETLGHPDGLVRAIVKPTLIWPLSSKAAQLLRLPNEENVAFLRAIGIAGKAERNSELVCLLSTHLLPGESTIRRSECEESRLVNIPAICF